jgi:hypothetical protein
LTVAASAPGGANAPDCCEVAVMMYPGYPFDHNGECVHCDELGEHADDCEFARAPIAVDAETVYRTLPEKDLRAMRQAFVLDLTYATVRRDREFIIGRIKLIDSLP